MSQLVVTDEGLIAAERADVFKAIIALMAGDTDWWSPHLFVRALGDKTPGVVGSRSEVRVPGRARFVARIDEVAAPALLRVTYVSGDFSGDGLWTFDAEPAGTRIRFRWQVVPTRWWMRWIASAVRRNHSRVMQLGFRALDSHLAQGRSASPASSLASRASSPSS
jgi:hypothetical protein